MERGVALPVEGGAEHHRCHHVEQEPGVVDQAAGDLRVVVVDGLEAGHDDLEENEPDSALLADGDHVHVVDVHDHLCRRAELIRHTITGYRLVCRHPSLCFINALLLVDLLFIKRNRLFTKILCIISILTAF